MVLPARLRVPRLPAVRRMTVTDTAKATELSEFVRICRAHKARTGTATPPVLFQDPDGPFYRFDCADGDAKLSFTALAAVSDEYDAMKAVEAAAREWWKCQTASPYT